MLGVLLGVFMSAIVPAEFPLADQPELKCLALNVYHEARGEPREGQVAVAWVVRNRMLSPRYPDSYCSVVTQTRSSELHKCQFSWGCDGRPDDARDALGWRRAVQVSVEVIMGLEPDPTGGAMWYHATRVKPVWRHKLLEARTIGRHIFYVPR